MQDYIASDEMRNKINVATITYHMSDNFGSVLQAYALNRLLNLLGFNSYIINYQKASVRELYKIIQPPTSLYNVLTDIYHLFYYSKLRSRQVRYSAFRENYLALSDEIYSSREQLQSKPPHADVYICGSDQIWNSSIVDFDDSYLLDFVKEGRKISYAASGISASTTQDKLAHISQLITTFDAVSVREKIAQNRLSAISAKAIAYVLDPVFLLSQEEWSGICVKPKEKHYMFCYFAGGVSKEFEHYTRELAKKQHMRRVILMPEWRNLYRPGKKAYEFGPIEFLSYLQNADFVCTNSFHGTAFSIIFNRPFVVGMHAPYTDQRIRSLLEDCSLGYREIDPSAQEIVDLEDLFNPDFSIANRVIEEKRKECILWISNAIEG